MRALSRGYQAELKLELWMSQGACFWRLVDLRRNGGIVGVAASEAEAMREARKTIEELSRQSTNGPAANEPNDGIVVVRSRRISHKQISNRRVFSRRRVLRRVESIEAKPCGHDATPADRGLGSMPAP